MAQAGRSVKHYHTNNGRFAYNLFVDAVNSKNQNLTFCRVGAHHQKCIIENNNKALTTGSKTLLLHGIIIWPQIIDDMFCPFSVKDAAERLKCLQVDILGRKPESSLHGVEVQVIPVNSYHTLFCPTYVLDARLQHSGGARLARRWVRKVCDKNSLV